MDRIRRLSKMAQDEFGVTIKSKSPTGETFESLYCNTKNDDRKEKHIEEMTKFVCMDCRYFVQCNDDTMCDGRPLSEVMKEDCWTRKYAEDLYNAGYRKADDVVKEIFEEIDNIIYNLMDSPFYSSGDAVYELTELKKKYTEE